MKSLCCAVRGALPGSRKFYAYLCTDDQVIFYEKCGYKKCDPILHSTTATSVFPVSKLKGFAHGPPCRHPAAAASLTLAPIILPTTTYVSETSSVQDPPQKRIEARPEKPVQECEGEEASQTPEQPAAQLVTATSASPPPASHILSPPPPPPPPLQKKAPVAPVSTADHQYMWKKLV
ncbi:hypothetical protein OSTOST_24800 [Ostertagia ostertagi]